jgi:hypothetical protein
MRFAQDTTSYVLLDWGCASSVIETFDFMLSLIVKPTCFKKSFMALTKKEIEEILKFREPYFRKKDFYGYSSNWENYKSTYLE